MLSDDQEVQKINFLFVKIFFFILIIQEKIYEYRFYKSYNF